MREIDAHRYCVYCSADCYLEPENQTHTTTCPVSTGLYPVGRAEVQVGMVCATCDQEFERGGFYVLANVTTGMVDQPSPEGGGVMCVSCAAQGVPFRA
jgi:hypothetical protein